MKKHRTFVALILLLMAPASLWSADLLAEIRADPTRSFTFVTDPAVKTAFPLFYSMRSINVGCQISATGCIVADAVLGTDRAFAPGDAPTFVDYASPAIDPVVTWLTNGADDFVGVGLVGVDGSGFTTSSKDFVALPESQFLFGIQKGPDLAGAKIDFIRLLVLKADISNDGAGGQTLTSNVVWQFYSGQPSFDGGGQSAEVDALLTYVSPLQRSTSLPAGTAAFPLEIVYGQGIDPTSFQATLNGQPAVGFLPAPGTSQRLDIPLLRGRNTLKLQVRGAKGADQDSLVFLVP